MTRQGNLNYSFLAKAGFLLGLGLFALGGGGELVAHTFFDPVPAWEETLLFDFEVAGLLIGFFSPFVFGIFFPLID